MAGDLRRSGGRLTLPNGMIHREDAVTTFQVGDMTCIHCAGKVTYALAALDATASVEVELPGRRVRVTSSKASAAELQAAIAQAGYTPVLVQDDAPSHAHRGGCGCGSS